MQSKRNQTIQHQMGTDPSVFSNEKYEFKPVIGNNMMVKTAMQLNHGNILELLGSVTKLNHRNMICLKKVGKSKRNTGQKVYWLYYEHVPHALINKYLLVPSSKFQQTMESLHQYLSSNGLHIEIKETNIGVSSNNELKVYIPLEDIMKGQSSKNAYNQKSQIDKLTTWYVKQFYPEQVKHKTANEDPSLKYNMSMGKEAKFTPSENKSKRFNDIQQHLENIRKKIRSVENKFQAESTSCHVPAQEEKTKSKGKFIFEKGEGKKNLNEKIQQNINCINIYHNTNKIVAPPPPKAPAYYHDFDTDSVDTYQMELGEDFQMPSMKTNQRLRQTVLTGGKSWDSLTMQSPQKKKHGVTESAGQNDFHRIIEDNRKKLNQMEKSGHKGYDSQTLHQENSPKTENWRSSTFRSDAPTNIQQRVEQALAKTKNVMSMLKKNTKSFSLQKI